MTAVCGMGRRRASRKSEDVFYAPPEGLGAALAEDLREARKERGGVNEAVAASCGVEPMTVYTWSERAGHQWTTGQIEAVIEATGGRHALVWLMTQAAKREQGAAAAGTGTGPFDVLERLGRIGEGLAALTRRAAEFLAPGGRSPGEFDARERRALAALTEASQAELVGVRTLIAGLE